MARRMRRNREFYEALKKTMDLKAKKNTAKKNTAKENTVKENTVKNIVTSKNIRNEDSKIKDNNILDGFNAENAIIVKGAISSFIPRYLDKLFGSIDGSYFLHSEKIIENKISGRKYKVVGIEINDKYTTIWFDITGKTLY